MRQRLPDDRDAASDARDREFRPLRSSSLHAFTTRGGRRVAGKGAWSKDALPEGPDGPPEAAGEVPVGILYVSAGVGLPRIRCVVREIRVISSMSTCTFHSLGNAHIRRMHEYFGSLQVPLDGNTILIFLLERAVRLGSWELFNAEVKRVHQRTSQRFEKKPRRSSNQGQ